MILGILLLLATFTGIESTPFAVAVVAAVVYKTFKKIRHGAFFVGGGVA